MLTYAQALAWAQGVLPEPFETSALLAFVLQVERVSVWAWPERLVPTEAWEAFQALIHRRAQGEPFAYLVGHKPFWDIDLLVRPGVLIPRPETECLLEGLCPLLSPEKPLKIVDLGTGSGAIALSLARMSVLWEVYATDRSAICCAQTAQNARRLGLERVQIYQGDWFSALPAGFQADVIISNPPYINEADACVAADVRDFEPHEALFSACQGRADLTHLITGAKTYLYPGGYLCLEHGYDQGDWVETYCIGQGLQIIKVLRDAADIRRGIIAKTRLDVRKEGF